MELLEGHLCEVTVRSPRWRQLAQCPVHFYSFPSLPYPPPLSQSQRIICHLGLVEEHSLYSVEGWIEPQAIILLDVARKHLGQLLIGLHWCMQGSFPIASCPGEQTMIRDV